MKRILITLMLAGFLGGTVMVPDALAWRKEITKKRAMRLAEYQIRKTTFPKYFDELNAMVRLDKHAQKYSGHWFVEFRSHPLLNMPSVLVVLEKASGEVVLTKDEYWPRAQPELDWVFN